MTANLRVLSFCAHQPYLYLFHKMEGVAFDLIQIREHKRFLQNWNPSVRPLPDHWRLIDRQTAEARLRQGVYQLAMAHNFNDYLDLMKFNIPLVMVVHVSLSGRFREEKTALTRDEYHAHIRQLVELTNGALVYVSQAKALDWGLPGTVIEMGLDPDEHGPWEGGTPAVLRVANHLRERGELLNYRAHQRITRGLPVTLVGQNPKLGGVPASSWDFLKSCYREHRVYLHTAEPGLEDGFNMAMVEAMAAGMPVITNAHPSSPIINGVHGYQSEDYQELNQRIGELFEDHEKAQALGQNARALVGERFHCRRFHQQWHEVFTRICS